MPTHAGQIGFIGGHKSASDKSPIDTALREFEEETDVSKSLIEIIGVMQKTATSTQSTILPVIGYIDEEPSEFIGKLKSNGEWDEAILVPYSYIREVNRWTYGRAVRENSEYKINFCTIHEGDFLSNRVSGDSQSHVLWGATAQMVWNFFKICP